MEQELELVYTRFYFEDKSFVPDIRDILDTLGMAVVLDKRDIAVVLDKSDMAFVLDRMGKQDKLSVLAFPDR